MTTDALIKNRDAIVGTLEKKVSPLKPVNTDKQKHMRNWEPWVRATIIDFDLISCLSFAEPSRDTCTLAYAPGGAAREIVTLTAPDGTFFATQLAHVLLQAELREDRASEILSQLGPPIAFWTPIVNLHPSRTPKTLELLDAALRLANFVEMRFKHALACRRPLEYSSQVQPMILTPGHGSLPSGHATEAFIVANVLAGLLDLGEKDEMREQLMRQAARVAINRQIAGVHFPVDSGAGQVLGSALAEYFLFRCKGAGRMRTWSFVPDSFGADGDFDWRTVALKPPVKGGADLEADAGPLGWIWREARAEYGKA